MKNPKIDYKKATEQLVKIGHSIHRANEVIEEAKASSNPAYILHHWGVRG